MMADTSTQRQRRSRAHRRGDHSQCDPLRPCRTGAEEKADPALWPRRSGTARIGTQEIVDDIAQKIRGGQLAGGTRLPTYYALTEIYDVSLTTVRRAMVSLHQRGLIHGHQGRAVYVARPQDH